jgi:ATP-dependent Zn protease
MVFDAVQPAVSPRLLSVMSQTYLVIFNRLSLDAVVRIGKNTLKNLSRHFSEATGIALVFEQFVPMVKLLVLSFSPYINMRRIQKRLPDLLLGQITRYIREGHPPPGKAVFRISKSAGAFLSRHYQVSANQAQQLFIRNEAIELGWDTTATEAEVTFTLARVSLKQLPPSKPLFQDDLPEVKFSTTGFEDIAGHGPVKKQLREIISILEKTDKVKVFGIKMPKGMLIYGPPGVGKTLLGKAFAKEANLPFVYASGGDLFDPNFIREVYQKARVFAPSIVFLDEIDVKGVVEGSLTAISAEQILMELEAVSPDPDEFIFTIVTAQNREEVHPELVSPGRIDISVEVPELDREARRFFIEKILEKPNDGHIDVDKVVRYISGMSGYELERIGQEAALFAIRNDLDVITEEILIDQINTIKYGRKLDRKQIRNIEADLVRTAVHEAAHAVASHMLLPHIKIEQVTITPRSETLGFVAYAVEDFDDNVSREEIFNNICVMLAGRVAQIRKFGPGGMDSGAGSDLEQATYMAYAAIAGLGMDEEIGFVHVDTLQHHVDKTIFQGMLEQRIQRWIRDASARVERLVEKHWEQIEHLASILIQQEIVDGAELEVLMGVRK